MQLRQELDLEEQAYRQRRSDHADAVSVKLAQSRRGGEWYQRLLHRTYRLAVPRGQRVLELGCSHGDLLAAVHPSYGLGIDLSEAMIGEAKRRHPELDFRVGDVADSALAQYFDIIILSDLINEVWDVRHVLSTLRPACHPGTRVILNFHNNLWRPFLSLARGLDWALPVLAQNWLTPDDVRNLLKLSGFEMVRHSPEILLPLPVPLLAGLANRALVKIWPFSAFALTHFVVARPAAITSDAQPKKPPLVSVLIPVRNEAGNIRALLDSVPEFPGGTELIFVEGHSSDNTYATTENLLPEYAHRRTVLMKQPGIGKADAVFAGFDRAKGDVLMILDGDMSVMPSDLWGFYNALVSGQGEFINGVRLVYPMQGEAMRFLNMVGNKLFGLIFSYLIGQPIKDTLCGTKVFSRQHYREIRDATKAMRQADPFGDFRLLFGASQMNLSIIDMPIRYRERTYGKTNIDRWRHGWMLIRMAMTGLVRVKMR